MPRPAPGRRCGRPRAAARAGARPGSVARVVLVAAMAALVGLSGLVGLVGLAGPAAASTTDDANGTGGTDGTDGTGATDGAVVVVGVTGLRWDDVSTLGTPALWELSRTAGVGLVAARGPAGASCPADGWLTLSTGTRAADLRVEDGSCRTLRDPAPGGDVPGWDDYLEAADQQSFDARPGLLGDTLAGADVPTASIGPGAAIALSDASGRPVGPHAALPGTSTALTQAVREALDGARLVVVDAGQVRDRGHATVARAPDVEGVEEPEPNPLAPEDDVTANEAIAEPTRAEQAREIDVRLEAVLRATRGTGATVLVVSLADSGRAALQLVAATGAAPSGGTYDEQLLTSGSTRQTGLVQSTDVTRTVLDAVGLPDGVPSLVGADIRPTAGPGTATERLDLLDSIAREASAVVRVSGPYTTRLVLAQGLLFLAAALLLTRTGRADRPPLRPALRVLRVVSLGLASVPVASFLTGLVPWWLAGSPSLAFWAVLLGWTVLIAAVAALGPWRRAVLGPAGVVAGVTVGVIALDMLTGSTLVVDSPMGAHRILAARFYGMSNQAFALLTAAGLLLAGVVADVLVRRGRRGLAALAVAGIGVLVVVVDGTPGLGSDFGGPPAIILAFTMLALVVSGRRVSWRTLLIIGLVAAVLLGGLVVLDWLRPAGDRTHLGRFLATALDGGLWDVVSRKVSVNLRVLTSWRYLLLAVGGVALTWLVLAGTRLPGRGTRGKDGKDGGDGTDVGPAGDRLLGEGSPLAGLQESVPLLRPTIAAIGLAMTVGFFINDSGIVIPATGIAVAVPLLVAAAAQWRLEHPGVAPGELAGAPERVTSGA